MGMVRLLFYERLEIEVLAGDMEGQHSARTQMPPIQLKSLRRQQVDWNCITSECVYGDHVIILRRLLRHGEARVSHNDLNLGFGFTGIAEQAPGNPLDLWVDIIKTKNVTRAAIDGNGTGAESDHADAARSSITTIIERKSNARIMAIISGGFGAGFVGKNLAAVLNGPVI